MHEGRLAHASSIVEWTAGPAATGSPCGGAVHAQARPTPTWHVLPTLHAPNEVELAIGKGLLQRVCRAGAGGSQTLRLTPLDVLPPGQGE